MCVTKQEIQMARPKSSNPPKTSVSIYLSEDVISWAQQRADKEDRSLSKILSKIIEQVKEHEQLIGH